MVRVLVLGGTAWVGREIAREHLARGAEVTCAARGRSGAVPDGATFVELDRLRPGAFDALAGDWDEVVEVAYPLELVTPALDALAARAAHWTLISSVSVYARDDEPGADESAALVDGEDPADYAVAKVLAERATHARLADRLLIVRPGLIAGPGDGSDRFGYWPARLARGGDVLAPDPGGRHVQVIDVADLAAFTAHAGASGLTGAINAVGHVHQMASFLEQAGEAAAFDGELHVADDAWLLAHGVNYWAGPRSLPLWLPADAVGFAQRSNAAYLAAGGTIRPLPETLRRTLDDERTRGLDRERRAGLTAADEADLLAALLAARA